MKIEVEGVIKSDFYNGLSTDVFVGPTHIGDLLETHFKDLAVVDVNVAGRLIKTFGKVKLTIESVE